MVSRSSEEPGTNLHYVDVIRDLETARPTGVGSVVTIGAYDGVHLGHRVVISEVRRLAAALGCVSSVVTFDRHPASIVRPESAPKLLTDLDQKLELLAATGLDTTAVVTFDAARATESPEVFVEDVIVRALGARVVVVGEDFHFGKGRAGNVALLRDMGLQLGFEVVAQPLVGGAGLDDGVKVSSTAVRTALGLGDAGSAHALLGRHHEVRGTIVHGDARGRELGFPTANVAVPADICLPSDGIYAAWYVRPDGVLCPAAVNLGRRPTFYNAQPYSLLEAFLIDFTGDLYGEAARVQFVERLRPELKFDGVDALIKQMQADVVYARAVLDSDHG